MAMSLTYTATTVAILPRSGYEEPEDRTRAEVIILNGAYSVKEFGNKKQWSVPLNNVSSANTAIINGWWENITKLTFTIDGDHWHNILIINEEKPLQMMGGTGWNNKYQGTLLLREI